jgi:hypothetical protein
VLRRFAAPNNPAYAFLITGLPNDVAPR